MKPYVFFILIFWAFGCQNQKSDFGSENPSLSISDVEIIAKRAGIKDSITIETHGGLRWLPIEAIEKHFFNERRALEADAETESYLKQTENVRTINDFEILLNTLPSVQEAFVTSHGGVENYEAWMKERRLVHWHIYRDTAGVLAWLRPEEDYGDQSSLGERIDNKPRTKSAE